MPILYSVVSRGTVILAKHASCAGNFAEVTEQILKKIPPNGGKLTYSHGRYLFHYVAEDGAVYFCITDEDFERSRAFAFLAEIRRRFQLTYGQRIQTALPYAMNSDFSLVLAGEMKAFSYSSEPTKLSRVQGQVDDLRTIMVKNIDISRPRVNPQPSDETLHLALMQDSIVNRGEKLELLIDRSETLEAGAVSFRTTSRSLARQLFLKNVKLTILILISLFVLIFIIVTASCGGFSYSKCQ